MKKKATLVLIIVIIIIGVIAGYYITNKINENKRDYSVEKITEYKYFSMKDNDKYGVIDETGKIIIDATYDRIEIPNPSKDVFICYKNDKGIAMNSNNQQLFTEYNSVVAIKLKNVVSNLPYEKSVLKSEKNGKYGIIDFSGKTILDTEYDRIEGFPGFEGQLEIQKNEKVGIINIKGNTLVKSEYDVINSDNYYNENEKNGYIVGIKQEDGYKYGYIDNKGKLKVKVEYNDISRVAEIPTEQGIYLIAAKNGQYGIIKDKKSMINNEYQLIEYDKTTKVFIAQKGKKFGVIDMNGKYIIPVENTKIEAKGEYIYVERNNIKAVYDSYGNKKDIDFSTSIIPTSNENYKIMISSSDKGNYYGVVDKNNKELINCEYLYIEYAFDKYFIACGQNGKLGVLDSNGKSIIELKYDLMQKVEGKNIIQSLFSETNTTELYDKDLKKICEMKNATINNESDYIKIYSDNEIKYLNNNGEIVTNKELFTNKKLYADCKNGKWGYIDSNGKLIVDYKYDFATELNSQGFGAVKKDGKWGSIDEKGKVIVEPEYVSNEKNGNISFIGEYIKINNGFDNEYYTKDLKNNK